MRSLLLFLLASPAIAHEGHGPSGPHLHGWDAGPLLIAVLAMAGALWLWKGRK